MRYENIRSVKRWALIALLALTLGQGGLLIHDATAEHSSSDVCQICAALDRPAAKPFIASSPIFQPFVAVLTFDSIVGLNRTEATYKQRSRAPPFL